MGKSSVARAGLDRLREEGLIAERLPLDEYPTPQAAAAYLATAFSGRGERAANKARSITGRVAGAVACAGEALSSPEAKSVGELLEGLTPQQITLPALLAAIPREPRAAHPIARCCSPSTRQSSPSRSAS